MMTTDQAPELFDKAVAGDAEATRRLILELAPIIQVRVLRCLGAYGGARNRRDLRQEVQDLAQEVYLLLFADQARVLRSWQQERGLSLRNFVGLVAERHTISVLRSRRRNPFTDETTADGDVDAAKDAEAVESGRTTTNAEETVASREVLREVVLRLERQQSPLGVLLFERLIVREEPVAEIQAETGLSAPALYMWRSRLLRAAKTLIAEITLEKQPRQRTPHHGWANQ